MFSLDDSGSRAMKTELATLVSLLGAVLCGCSTTKQAVVLSSPTQTPSAKDIVDLPIEHIEIRGYRMKEALRLIADSIATRSGQRLHFYYGLTSSASEAASQTAHPLPVDKLIIRDPVVSIQASTTTLRAVLDSLCAQAGWSYEYGPKGYVFIDDKSLFTAAARRFPDHPTIRWSRLRAAVLSSFA